MEVEEETFILDFCCLFNARSDEKLVYEKGIFYWDEVSYKKCIFRKENIWLSCESHRKGCTKRIKFNDDGTTEERGRHSKRCLECNNIEIKTEIVEYEIRNGTRMINDNDFEEIVCLFKEYFYEPNKFDPDEIEQGIEGIKIMLNSVEYKVRVVRYDRMITAAMVYRDFDSEIYVNFLVGTPGYRAGMLLISSLKTMLNKRTNRIVLATQHYNYEYYKKKHEFILVDKSEEKKLRDRFNEHETRLILMQYKYKSN